MVSNSMSTPALQRAQNTSTAPFSTRQNPQNTTVAPPRTNQQPLTMPAHLDPSERWSGTRAKVLNKRWNAAERWSVHKAKMEMHHPDILKYYEDRRTGKIEAKAFEEWEGPVSKDEAERLENIATSKVRHTFFAMDYSHGFTGRGVLPETLERPCLVGPWDETVEEIFGESTLEQLDRPLWRASDKGHVVLSEKSKDEDDVVPMGESRDEHVDPSRGSRNVDEEGPLGDLGDDLGDEKEEGETVDPLGRPRDENGGVRQGHHVEEEEGKSRQLEECGFSEGMDGLMQLAAVSVAMISNAPADTGDAMPPHAATTSPTEPWAPSTSSRKRARDSADEARAEEFPSRRKRMRMDEVLGINRASASAAEVPQSVRAAMTPVIQQPIKRSRSLDDDSEDDLTKPQQKRLRLCERITEICDVEEKFIEADRAEVAENDESTLVYQDTHTTASIEATIVDKTPMDTKAHKQPFVENEPSNDEGEGLGENAFAEHEAARTEEVWDTAHGINSNYANIYVPGKGVFDATGVWRHLYLSTSTGSPNRPWAEDEKEDLRVYIQDYGIEDWALLSQSTNRPEEELQYMYFEVVTARNVQAGRLEDAGIPQAYPDLAPPTPPVAEEPRKLRPLEHIGKANKNNLGDLTYDVKATSFPRVTRDGGMVDSAGNSLLGIMGDISHTTKRRKPKSLRKDPVTLPSAERSHNNEPTHVRNEGSESETEGGEIIEEEDSDQQTPAPFPLGTGLVRKKKGLLNVVKNGRVNKASSNRRVNRKAGHQAEAVNNEDKESIERKRAHDNAPPPGPKGEGKEDLMASVEDTEDAAVKQDDSDQERQLPNLTAPRAKTTSAKGPLGPQFAGVSKLAGSSRRGVPRKAAGRYSGRREV